jgi:hypothetical protein
MTRSPARYSCILPSIYGYGRGTAEEPIRLLGTGSRLLELLYIWRRPDHSLTISLLAHVQYLMDNFLSPYPTTEARDVGRTFFIIVVSLYFPVCIDSAMVACHVGGIYPP